MCAKSVQFIPHCILHLLNNACSFNYLLFCTRTHNFFVVVHILLFDTEFDDERREFWDLHPSAPKDNDLCVQFYFLMQRFVVNKWGLYQFSLYYNQTHWTQCSSELFFSYLIRSGRFISTVKFQFFSHISQMLPVYTQNTYTSHCTSNGNQLSVGVTSEFLYRTCENHDT